MLFHATDVVRINEVSRNPGEFRFRGGNVKIEELLTAKSSWKCIVAVGANSAGGDQQVTLTGSVVGDRVQAIIGLVTEETGHHTFLLPMIGTHFESVISVVDKIVQKQAAGDLTANTYLFILVPVIST